MSLVRTIIGTGLALVAIFCFYMEYIYLLYVGINLAVAYDAYYLYYSLNQKKIVVIIFLLSMLLFNYHLMQRYFECPMGLIKMIAITQVSDIYQYISGSRCGINKIGWISKNKSYEGYYFGLVMTIATFLPIDLLNNLPLITSIYEIVTVYVMGVMGGLLSSYFKRMMGIKDYSDLLGPHGGWVDRIDSVVLAHYFIGCLSRFTEN